MWEAAALDPHGIRPRLYFQRVAEAKTAKNRMHLDINVDSTVAQEVDRLVELGASVLYEHATGNITMQDPEGNEFCVQVSEEMSQPHLRISPLDETTWDDFAGLLGKSGGDAGCWDMYWRVTNTSYRSMLPDQRRDAIRALAHEGATLGVLAYDDDDGCVAWCSAGPRSNYERLVRSRDFAGLLSGGDDDVWSIVCFFIDRGARRRGMAAGVVSSVVGFARTSGAAAVEAYPADSRAPKLSASAAFHGTSGMFETCGFRAVGLSRSIAGGLRRPVMRLTFAD